MMTMFYKLYAYVFARRVFYKMNCFLYSLSLRGMGVLNYQNDFLTGEKAWLASYLSKKVAPVVIDVGANIGDYSCAVFKVNPKSTVVAFEPHPKTYKKLAENIKEENFTSYNLGLSDELTLMKLYDYADRDGSSHASLYKNVIKELHHGGEPISHSVEVVRLDSFLEKEKIEFIDLLKIDTEGNELKVLKGAGRLLKQNKIKAIHFEFNEMNIESKTSFKDFWGLLNNYQLYRILPRGELIEICNYRPIFCEIYAFQNIVAILKE